MKYYMEQHDTGIYYMEVNKDGYQTRECSFVTRREDGKTFPVFRMYLPVTELSDTVPTAEYTPIPRSLFRKAWMAAR